MLIKTYLARAILTCDNPLRGKAKVSTVDSLLMFTVLQKNNEDFLFEILRLFLRTVFLRKR